MKKTFLQGAIITFAGLGLLALSSVLSTIHLTEPTTMMLLGTGLIGLATIARRKNNNKVKTKIQFKKSNVLRSTTT